MSLKQLSLLFIAVLVHTISSADTESNNSAGTANSLSFGASVSGTVNHSDPDDYYEINVTNYGTVTVTMRMTGGHGDVWLSDAQDDFLSGDYSDDDEGDISRSCLAPGKYYVIAKSGGVGSSGVINYNLSVNFSSSTTYLDNEPNSTFQTAIPLAEGVTAEGNLGYLHSDQDDPFTGHYDYKDIYQIVTSKAGTLNINGHIAGTIEGSFTVERTNGADLSGSSVYNELNGNITYTAHCVEQDTFYVTLQKQKSGCDDYTFSYSVEGTTYDSDTKTNDSFSSAEEIVTDVYHDGQLGFYESENNATDLADYYKFYIEDNCDMLFRVNSDSSFSHVNLTIWNANEKNIEGSGNGDGLIEIRRECVKEGWYFAKIISTGCGGYQFIASTDTISSYMKDLENNDNADSAKYVAQGSNQEGNIGYKTGSLGEEDDYDWYMLITDQDGNISIPFEADSALDWLTLSLFPYPYPSSELASIQGIKDTLKYNCLSQDTFLLEISHSKNHCGGYLFRYNMEALSYINDKENNEKFSEAILLQEQVASQGHLGYLKEDGATDMADLYMITGVKDEHINVILSNNGNLADSMTIQVLDNNGSLVAEIGDDGQFENYQELSVCDFPSDTGYIDLLASDCGSYSIRYLKDTTVILIDSLGPLCKDSSIHTLNATPAGGFWIGLGTNGTSMEFNVAEATTGLNLLIYNVLTFNTCYSREGLDVQINALPEVSIIDPNDPWCDNDTIKTLLASPSGGVWSGTGIVDASLGKFNPRIGTPSGNLINYEYIDTNGCANSDTTTIRLFETPFVEIFNNDTVICHPDSNMFLLNAEPLGGAWSGKGITGIFTGEYTTDIDHGYDQVSYTVTTDDNCFETDTVLIENIDGPLMYWNVSPAPGFSVTASSEFTGADSYYIDFGDGTVINMEPETIYTHDYAAAGDYEVCFTSIRGFCSKTECDTIRASETGSTNDLSYSNVQMFPNPSSGLVSIDSPENKTAFSVSTLQGKIVNTEVLEKGLNIIDLSKLSKGTYLVKLSTTANGIQSGLLIIE